MPVKDRCTTALFDAARRARCVLQLIVVVQLVWCSALLKVHAGCSDSALSPAVMTFAVLHGALVHTSSCCLLQVQQQQLQMYPQLIIEQFKFVCPACKQLLLAALRELSSIACTSFSDGTHLCCAYCSSSERVFSTVNTAATFAAANATAIAAGTAADSSTSRRLGCIWCNTSAGESLVTFMCNHLN
jgi:hypothetical protein